MVRAVVWQITGVVPQWAISTDFMPISHNRSLGFSLKTKNCFFSSRNWFTDLFLTVYQPFSSRNIFRIVRGWLPYPISLSKHWSRPGGRCSCNNKQQNIIGSALAIFIVPYREMLPTTLIDWKVQWMKELPYHSIFLENLLATKPKPSKKNYGGKISLL